MPLRLRSLSSVAARSPRLFERVRRACFRSSTENMVAVVAGGGLKGGHHIAASGSHPAAVTLSAMQAAGYPDDALGEVSGGIGELFG